MIQRKVALLRALKPNIEKPVGQTFWSTSTRATSLIQSGAAELVDCGMVPHGTFADILCKSNDYPLNRLSTVLKKWAGRPAVIIAGGPSLTREQVHAVDVARVTRGLKTIAVNDAYLWAPWADVLYASDSSWWRDHARGIDKFMIGLNAAQVRERFEAFAGLRCSIQDAGGEAATDGRIHILRNARVNPQGDGIHANGLSLEPDALLTGCNSGWQAINLAALAGASPLILLGFDGRPAPDGRSHWSGGHPRPTPQQAYECYRAAFSAGADGLRAAGIPVFNCSPGTGVDAFEKKELVDAIAGLPITV